MITGTTTTVGTGVTGAGGVTGMTVTGWTVCSVLMVKWCSGRWCTGAAGTGAKVLRVRHPQARLARLGYWVRMNDEISGDGGMVITP